MQTQANSHENISEIIKRLLRNNTQLSQSNEPLNVTRGFSTDSVSDKKMNEARKIVKDLLRRDAE